MSSYTTLDYLSPFMPSASSMAAARALTFSTSATGMAALGYEREAIYYESGNSAILRDLFKVNLTEGASYFVYSSSYFDPYLLSIHDLYGRFIATDTGNSYGNDTISYIAPYTGTYYINASWDQGVASSHKFVYLSISEDIDTAKPSDLIAPIVITFSPADESASVPVYANINVTFSEPIARGTGSIYIETSAGVPVASYDAATSSNLSISGSTLTINPTINMSYSTTYKVAFAYGAIKDVAGNSYLGSSSYNFTTVPTLSNSTSGNDVFYNSFLTAENIDGGLGIDTVINDTNSTFYSMKGTEAGWSLGPPPNIGIWMGRAHTLTNVERLQFTDKSIALDISGNAGQVYRLYQAAFNRTPDKGGLGDWIYAMDNGMTLLDVSAGFVTSAEFKSIYGQNPTDSEVVTRFYQNVLHRAPEQAGYDYWMNQLQSGLQTRTQVLTGFSESPENQVQVIGVIGNGIDYTPHHL